MIRKALSHTLSLVVGAAAVFLVLQAIQWYYPSPLGSLYNPSRTHEVAIRSPVARGVASTPVPSNPVVLTPTPKQAKKIEKKLGSPLPPGKLLTVAEVKSICQGADIVVTLEPVDVTRPEAGEKTVVTVYPKKRKFFEWKLERSVGLYTGYGSGSITGQIWNAEFEQSLFRVGPAILSVKAGGFVGSLGNFGYVMVGAKVTF